MAKSPGAGQGLFASSARALRRLQAQFEALKNRGHDPTIVQFTADDRSGLHRDLLGRAGYELFDLTRDSRTGNELSGTLRHDRHIASWQVEDGHEKSSGG